MRSVLIVVIFRTISHSHNSDHLIELQMIIDALTDAGFCNNVAQLLGLWKKTPYRDFRYFVGKFKDAVNADRVVRNLDRNIHGQVRCPEKISASCVDATQKSQIVKYAMDKGKIPPKPQDNNIAKGVNLYLKMFQTAGPSFAKDFDIQAFLLLESIVETLIDDHPEEPDKSQVEEEAKKLMKVGNRP
jgi:hypothetical protein